MSTITQKGQVTIPKPVRDILEVKQGDEVVFDVEDDRVVVRKKQRTAAFRKYVGVLKDKEGEKVEDIVRRLREERE